MRPRAPTFPQIHLRTSITTNSQQISAVFNRLFAKYISFLLTHQIRFAEIAPWRLKVVAILISQDGSQAHQHVKLLHKLRHVNARKMREKSFAVYGDETLSIVRQSKRSKQNHEIYCRASSNSIKSFT